MLKLKRHKVTRGGSKIYLLGLFLSVTLILALSFISSMIASSAENPSVLIGVLALISLIVSGAITGFAISKIKGDGGLGVASCVALTTALLIILVSVIICGKLTGGTIMNCVCYVSVSSFGGFIAKHKKARRKRRR